VSGWAEEWGRAGRWAHNKRARANGRREWVIFWAVQGNFKRQTVKGTQNVSRARQKGNQGKGRRGPGFS